jgi:hypothetical protein
MALQAAKSACADWDADSEPAQAGLVATAVAFRRGFNRHAVAALR